MKNKKLVFLDTDMGLGTPRAELDDAAALITLAASPAVRLLAAGATYGNVPLESAVKNLARAIEMLSCPVRIAQGADQPLQGSMRWFDEWQKGYGKTIDWPPPADLPQAADAIIESVSSNPRQVTLLAVGPLTDLALAVQRAPSIVPLVQEVVCMGGSFGAQNAAPEFNMRCDPEAAQIVLSAGWRITLIGLDMTRRIRFSSQEFDALDAWNPFIELLKEQAPAWIERVESMGWEKNGCCLHDAVAAAYVIDPSLFTLRRLAVDIELAQTEQRGSTRFGKAGSPASKVAVVTDLDRERVHALIYAALNQQEEKHER